MKRTGFVRKTTTPLKRSGFKKSTIFLKRSNFKRKLPNSDQAILDGIVSKCVRLASADQSGLVHCVTCGEVYHWKDVDCGHFQKRGNLATRYNIKNLGPQCRDCNRFNDGENEKFAEFIDNFYGLGTADLLRQEAKLIYVNFPYKEEILKWTIILEQLTMSKNSEIEY